MDQSDEPSYTGANAVPNAFGGSGVLLLVAAEAEARAAMRGLGCVEDTPCPIGQTIAISALRGVRLARTGVGKVNAAVAVAMVDAPSLVVTLGIAGALPNSGLAIGDVVVADRCVYADEGILTPGGFQDCATMGFPLGPFDGRGIAVGSDLVSRLCAALATGEPSEGTGPALVCRVGAVATVSTCSGTDALAAAVAARTGAVAEAMEGAAAAHAAQRRGMRAAEVRVISNTTGDRERQVWDMRRALGNLAIVAGAVGRTFAAR